MGGPDRGAIGIGKAGTPSPARSGEGVGTDRPGSPVAPDTRPSADLIERLRDVLAGYPTVSVAYLFGSHARRRPTPISDVDVAVLLDPAFTGNRFALRLELAGAIAEAIGSEAVDVVLLDEAPPALAYRVLRDGRLILSRDEVLRIRHRLRAIDEYLDTEPLRRRAREILRRRLAEGTFGRS